MNKRLQRLEEYINKQTIYITDRADMYYYSAFSGEGALVICGGKGYIITDGRYTEAAAKSSPGFEVVNTLDHYVTLKKLGGKILFQSHALPYSAYQRLSSKGIELIPSDIDFEALRSVKMKLSLKCFAAPHR